MSDVRTRGIGRVVYVPGPDAHSVTKSGYSPVEVPDSPGRDQLPSRYVTTAREVLDKTDWSGHGILAIYALAAVRLAADGAALCLIGWWLYR